MSLLPSHADLKVVAFDSESESCPLEPEPVTVLRMELPEVLDSGEIYVATLAVTRKKKRTSPGRHDITGIMTITMFSNSSSLTTTKHGLMRWAAHTT